MQLFISSQNKFSSVTCVSYEFLGYLAIGFFHSSITQYPPSY